MSIRVVAVVIGCPLSTWVVECVIERTLCINHPHGAAAVRGAEAVGFGIQSVVPGGDDGGFQVLGRRRLAEHEWRALNGWGGQKYEVTASMTVHCCGFCHHFLDVSVRP